MLCEDYAPEDVTICLDGHESARALVRLLRRARHFVFYSAFICDVTHPLPGTGRDGDTTTTLLRLPQRGCPDNEGHAAAQRAR